MKQYVLNIMSVFLYSCVSHLVGKVHLFYAALYCHMWPIWFYHIFLHYLINGMILEKMY